MFKKLDKLLIKAFIGPFIAHFLYYIAGLAFAVLLVIY